MNTTSWLPSPSRRSWLDSPLSPWRSSRPSNGATAPTSQGGPPTERKASLDITVAGITKDFGDAAALSDIDLAISSGELVALLGPSGSGKTTLLRVIAGLEIPDKGQVLFGHE